MISYDIGEGRFNLRAVAVIIRNGDVLVHRAETDNFWALPGGRVEIFEPTLETLCREMKEELNCSVRVDRLLWIVENFFKHENKPYHEVAFYYRVALEEPIPANVLKSSFDGWEVEGNVRLLFQWISLDTAGDIPLYPTFLRPGLRNLPAYTEHVVHWDPEE